jgi:hypothetical protein
VFFAAYHFFVPSREFFRAPRAYIIPAEGLFLFFFFKATAVDCKNGRARFFKLTEVAFHTEFFEKIGQQRRAFFFANAFRHANLMIKTRLVENVENRTGATGFRVFRAENDLGNARLNDCARAHRTRLKRDV